MYLQQIYDSCLAQYAYLIACQATGEALVIDPERDVDRYLAIADEKGFRIVGVAETHIHADFLSGARELADCVGAKLYLSAEGESTGWASKWAKGSSYKTQFLHDGDSFKIGNITLHVEKTPGHTPEHISFLVQDYKANFPMGMISGDFLFVGDLGRPDLLEKAAKIEHTMDQSARVLFGSAKHLVENSNNDHLIVWPAHGAGSACGKGLGAVPHSSVGYEKRQNPALQKVREGEQSFVEYILKDQPEPPYYFARMKAQNRDGVPLLKHLPEPRRLSVQELAEAVKEGRLLPIDTRDNRSDFFHRHLPRSLFAPFHSNFCTVVGSLIADAETPLLLIVAPENEEEAIRRLVRIGYDRIEAVATFDTLSRYLNDGGDSRALPAVTFKDAEEIKRKGGVIVDLRFLREYEAGHIDGVVHAPYTRLVEYVAKLPRDQPIVVHCRSGFRASVSAAFLQREGFDVYAVDDYYV